MTARHSYGALRKLPRQTPLSFAGERIGLMGGSFNPPHVGHLETAQAALARLQLDRMWWIVSPGNPLKAGEALAPLANRVAACEALATDPRIVVTAFESDLTTPYTVDTLNHLLNGRPTTRFVWVMGADSLATFHRWRHWQDIFVSLPIAVVDRPGWRFKAMASPAALRFRSSMVPDRHASSLADRLPPAWSYLTVPQNPLSSSELRSANPQSRN